MAKFYGNGNVTASVCGRPVRVSHSMSYPTIQVNITAVWLFLFWLVIWILGTVGTVCVWLDDFSLCCLLFSAAPVRWCTSVRSPAVNTQTTTSWNSPSRSGESRSISLTGSRERYRTRTEQRPGDTLLLSDVCVFHSLKLSVCPQCFIEMENAEDAEKMAEDCKANPPKLNGKRLTIYVSRKYRQLKHGWVSSSVVNSTLNVLLVSSSV